MDAQINARRNYLDHPGYVDLGSVRRACLGSVLQFNAGPRRRLSGRNVCIAQDWNGPAYVALWFWMVPVGAVSIAHVYRSRIERQSRAQDSARLGNSVRELLAVLDSLNVSRWYNSVWA